jgi:hypothetical protein
MGEEDSDRFVSALGCTVRVLSTAELSFKPGPGVLMSLRMNQPGDGRYAEVYLNEKDIGELITLLQAHRGDT